VTKRSLTPPPYLLTYYVICLHFNGLFAPRDREVIEHSAIFVDILRHLFTYQRLNLVLFAPLDRLGKFIRHICWHSTSFLYISEAKVRFIHTTWPPEGRSAAIFVDILRHFRSIDHWTHRHVCLHHVACDVTSFRKSGCSLLFCLSVLARFFCIPVICQKFVLFLAVLQFVKKYSVRIMELERKIKYIWKQKLWKIYLQTNYEWNMLAKV